MYEGSNPTALQSQKWLVESLLALMTEKPYAKISVIDICKKADLSRQTFYNFFSDKEEILRYYLQNKYQKELLKYKNRSTLSMSEIVASFINVLTENEKVLSYMLDNGLDLLIAEEIAKCVDLFARYFVSSERNDDMLIYSEALLSGALGSLLVQWLKEENKASVDKITDLLYDFFKGDLFELEI